MKLVVGLGNPGEEYENTRHNAGWLMLDFILGKKVSWGDSKNTKALFYKDNSIEYLKPTTFMNNSGSAVLYAKEKHKVRPENVIVIYDDLDLPLGKMKISFNRSAGGHRGLASVIRALRSEEFLRIRVGIAPATPSGKLKKPKGEKEVIKFILSKFKPSELQTLKKLSKKVAEAIETIFSESKEKAMSLYN